MQSQSIDNTSKENLFQKICRLAEARDEKRLIEIIDNGFTLNVRSGKYESPLQWLIEQNDLESVKFLANNSQFKINVDCAVFAYAQAGCIEEVDALVEQGANYGNALCGFALGGQNEQIEKWLENAKSNNTVFDPRTPAEDEVSKIDITTELLKPLNLNQAIFGYALKGDKNKIDALLQSAQPDKINHIRAINQAVFGFALGKHFDTVNEYLENFKKDPAFSTLKNAALFGFALAGLKESEILKIVKINLFVHTIFILFHGYALGGYTDEVIKLYNEHRVHSSSALAIIYMRYAQSGHVEQLNTLFEQGKTALTWNGISTYIRIIIEGYALNAHVEQVNKYMSEGESINNAVEGYASGNYLFLDEEKTLLRILSCTNDTDLRYALAQKATVKHADSTTAISNEDKQKLDKLRKTLYTRATQINKNMQTLQIDYPKAKALTVPGAITWMLQAGPRIHQREIFPEELFWKISALVVGLSIEETKDVFSSMVNHIIGKNEHAHTLRAYERKGHSDNRLYNHTRTLFDNENVHEKYVIQVKNFKEQLAVVLENESIRLDKSLLHPHESKKKALRLRECKDKILSPDNSICSFLDILDIVNKLLIDPDIVVKPPVFGIFASPTQEITTTEKSILKFMQELFTAFSFTIYQNEKTATFLLSFTENTDLNSVLNSYKKYFSNQIENVKKWETSSALSIISAIDDIPVIFDTDNLIAGTSSQARIKQNTLGKNILNNLVRYLSYLLANTISPDSISNSLRICLASNHMNRHWTAMVVDVQGLKTLYSRIYSYRKDQRLAEIGASPMAHVKLGRAEKYIRDFLDLEENKEPSFDTLARKIQPHVFDITVYHYDSMNNSYYHQVAEESVKHLQQVFGDAFSFQRKQCSQQLGHTCGDHTIYNLVSVGLLKQQPNSINSPASPITSTTLRQLTNAKEEERPAIIDFIFVNTHNKNNQLASTSQQTIVKQSLDKVSEKKLETFIDQYMERINQLAPKMAETLFQIILYGEMEKLPKMKMSSEVEDRVQTLYALLQENGIANAVQNILFRELSIPQNSYQAAALAVRIYIEDREDFQLINATISNDNLSKPAKQ